MPKPCHVSDGWEPTSTPPPLFCHFEQVQVVGLGLSVWLLHPLGRSSVRFQSRSEKDPSDFSGAKIATEGSFSLLSCS